MISLAEYTGFRRQLRDGCIGKKRFPTFEAAEAACARLIRTGVHRPERGSLNAYDCRQCGWWHVGHQHHAFWDLDQG